MMTEKEKMLSGRAYNCNEPQLVEERQAARRLAYQYNNTHPDAVEERIKILKQLLGGGGDTAYIEPPFSVDYGYNLTVGQEFYANFGCVILDCAPVTIGSQVMLGPGVQIFTAGHPLDAELRTGGFEFAHPITIGDRVWLGGGSVILPGVTIGSDTVIGAGSVVNKSIPAGVVAVGNPCRVLREITQKDHRNFYNQYIQVED